VCALALLVECYCVPLGLRVLECSEAESWPPASIMGIGLSIQLARRSARRMIKSIQLLPTTLGNMVGSHEDMGGIGETCEQRGSRR
jgi:hypothetical protein